jgi:hypothetical protein
MRAAAAPADRLVVVVLGVVGGAKLAVLGGGPRRPRRRGGGGGGTVPEVGEDGGIDDLIPPKPKGMHWKTYSWKIDEIDDVETRADAHLTVYRMRLMDLDLGD